MDAITKLRDDLGRNRIVQAIGKNKTRQKAYQKRMEQNDKLRNKNG